MDRLHRLVERFAVSREVGLELVSLVGEGLTDSTQRVNVFGVLAGVFEEGGEVGTFVVAAEDEVDGLVGEAIEGEASGFGGRGLRIVVVTDVALGIVCDELQAMRQARESRKRFGEFVGAGHVFVQRTHGGGQGEGGVELIMFAGDLQLEFAAALGGDVHGIQTDRLEVRCGRRAEDGVVVAGLVVEDRLLSGDVGFVRAMPIEMVRGEGGDDGGAGGEGGWIFDWRFLIFDLGGTRAFASLRLRLGVGV